MRIHESNVPTWFFEFEPGDGTRYAIHVQTDYYGGWLVAWRDAQALFWLSDDLEDMKPLTKGSNDELRYSCATIHYALRSVAWGPYINGNDE